MNILMCRPDHFDIDYEINPWMHTTEKVNPARALEQWTALRELYEALGATITLAPQPTGIPDMVFSANAGLVWKNKAIVARFHHVERQGEEEHWRAAFHKASMDVLELPDGYSFEGAGDGLFVGETLYLGFGPRSDRETHTMIAELLDVEAVSLELVDPHFYHLDTCFSPLGEDAAMYFPPAFTQAGVAEIRRRVTHAIPVPQTVADGFSCNSMVIGDVIVATPQLLEIADDLADVDLQPQTLEMTEFMKSGGAVRCLSLPLDIGTPSYQQLSHTAHHL